MRQVSGPLNERTRLEGCDVAPQAGRGDFSSRHRGSGATKLLRELVPPRRGSIFFRPYPPFPARMRSPSGWAKLWSRLRRFIFVVNASSLLKRQCNSVTLQSEGGIVTQVEDKHLSAGEGACAPQFLKHTGGGAF
jgi:hypothetical protein